MRLFISPLIFSIFSGFIVNGNVILLVDEKFQDCSKDKLISADFSGLSYDFFNDTLIFLNGDIKILRNIQSSWKCHIYIEKFDRGKWNIALIDRKVEDFCKSIQNPTEVWYRFTSRLKHKNCPFEAGYVETFDNMQVGKLPAYISYGLVGKYRFTLSNYLPNEENEIKNECMRLGFEIMEA